jgi:hypothetical protein
LGVFVPFAHPHRYKNAVCTLSGVLIMVLLPGCGIGGGARSVAPNENGAFDPIAGMAVTPEEALEQAGPFLDLTFQLRRRDRGEDAITGRPPTDHIAVKDGWYYIVRDDQSSLSTNFYLPHAVRIHGQTGQLLPPE